RPMSTPILGSIFILLNQVCASFLLWKTIRLLLAICYRYRMLRSEWLQAFGAFAERLSFTQAARALHLSQPALFVQIRKLSEEIGVPLYEKRGQKLSLTPAGERLLAYARESHERDSELLEELRTGERNSAVTLAAGEGAYLYLLSKPLRESKARLRLLVRD